MAGKFIVLEGIDGSGKSTQAHRLCVWLNSAGFSSLHTREPDIFRDVLLNSDLSSQTELLIFLADRSEHSRRVIIPSLEAGINVICERWNASTLAYQNSPIAQNLISQLNFPVPDIEIYLDISPALALQRMQKRGLTPDIYEKRGISFLEEVRTRYLQISRQQKMLHVNCTDRTEDEIFSRILAETEHILCPSV